MKKLLTLSLVVIAVMIAGCRKSKSGGGGGGTSNDYYLRFKSNGTQFEYKAHPETIYNKANGATEFITTLGATKEQFVPTKSNITVALTTVGTNSLNTTFTNYTTTNAGFKKAKIMQLGFFDANGKFFQSWAEEFSSILPAGSPINCRLIFTEATSTYLKGNFSGTIFSSDYLTRLEITEGEFYLKQR